MRVQLIINTLTQPSLLGSIVSMDNRKYTEEVIGIFFLYKNHSYLSKYAINFLPTLLVKL